LEQVKPFFANSAAS